MSKKQAKSTSARKNKVATSPIAQSKADTSSITMPQGTEASCNQSKVGTPSVPASMNKGNTTLYRYMYQLSKAAQGFVVKKLPLIVPSIILTLLGFKQLPQSVPLLSFAREHQVASPIIGAVLVLLFVAAMIIPLFPASKPKDDDDEPEGSTRWPVRPWVVATGMSTACFVVSSILLLIVLSSACLVPKYALSRPSAPHLWSARCQSRSRFYCDPKPSLCPYEESCTVLIEQQKPSHE